MYSKSYRYFLAALLAVSPVFANEEAAAIEADSAEAVEVAASAPVEAAVSAPISATSVKVSDDELIDMLGYLTAQGAGAGALQLDEAGVNELASGLKKALVGEIDLMTLAQADLEVAFGEAQARANALESGAEEVPGFSEGSLEKIGAVLVAQSGLTQLGFGAEHADLIHTGFLKGAAAKTMDPSIEAKMPAFQEFIQVRIKTAQAKIQADQAAERAAAQEAVMAEFKATADEWKVKENFNIVLETTQGEVEIELMPSIAPLAVANFVGHIESGYYNDLTFHRVIDGFMIQGGDPEGTGMGGQSIWEKPFPDEFSPEARFDEVGILAMANSGPVTNGSQFFITTSTPQWLNDKHTIFGKVVAGYDNVVKIEKVETAGKDKPAEVQKIVKAYVK